MEFVIFIDQFDLIKSKVFDASSVFQTKFNFIIIIILKHEAQLPQKIRAIAVDILLIQGCLTQISRAGGRGTPLFDVEYLRNDTLHTWLGYHRSLTESTMRPLNCAVASDLVFIDLQSSKSF